MTSTRIALIVAFVLALAKTACAVDLEVSELVGAIKHGIAEAQKSASPPKMKIPWIEAEISYVVKQEGGGGVKLYVVTVDGRYATETVQRVKYRLEPDAPLKVEGPGELSGAIAGVDRAAGRVFITSWADVGKGASHPLAFAAFPFVIKGGTTKIIDGYGVSKGLTELKPGMNVKVEYAHSDVDYGFVAQRITVNPAAR
jgi:NTP-dependent ternary system trypsin peptidase co-occuring protein